MTYTGRNADAYIKAVKTYGEIKDWCKENDITDFNTMLSRMETEKPDWAVLIDNKISARIFFINWFNSMHRYDATDQARAEGKKQAGRGNAKHDRRPVPCICTDTGEEFRSFTQAAKSIGVNNRQIMDCCYGVRPSVKGYHFKLKETNNEQDK